MRGFQDDLRFGFRSLAKSPGFTAVGVLVLGLGIGANTAIFSFLNALLLRPFPFAELDELVTLWETHPQTGGLPDAGHASVGRRYPSAPADYLDFLAADAFERIAAYRHRELNLSDVDEPERLRGVLVSGGFFPMLGAAPALGRAFLPEEETPGRDAVVILSHVFWRDRFGSDPAALGRTCTLNGRRYTVVGVMPADFEFPLGGVRVFLPLALTPEERADRSTLSLQLLGRLRPGVTLEHAQSAMDGMAARLARDHPRSNAGRGVALVRLAEQQVGFTARFALLFQAAAALVLLITCANVAGLLLARAWGRQREVALRVALGAGRWRVMRQLLAESLVLSLCGGVVALLVAYNGVDFIRNSLPQDIAQWVGGWSGIQVDGRALAFTLAVACVTSLAVGLAPARLASRWELTDLLKDGGRASASRAHTRLRSLLVVCELTLALVLLGGASLMVRGFVGMTNAYQGFEPEDVLTMRITLPGEAYRGSPAAQFFRGLEERIRSLPGVQSVSVASQVVGDLGPMPGGPFDVEGRPTLSPADRPAADLQAIGPGYFETLRIPLRAGRAFADGEGGSPAAPVAIVSEGLARRFWPDAEPLGRRIRLGPATEPGPWLQVVGVAGDVRQYWYDQPRLTIYVPHPQSPRTQMCVLVRTAGDPYAMLPRLRAQVQALDRNQPVFEVLTLADVVRQSVAIVRMAATLMVSLGLLALVLAALGVYGIVAQQAGQRTHEIGIRMAIGARRSQILGLVVGRALRLTAVGMALGVPISWALSRAMGDALFGVARPEPWELAALVLVLTSVAAAASYLPARRAAQMDPASVLRSE